MTWADHQVIDNLPRKLAKNWGNEAKGMSSVLTGVTQAGLGLWPQIVSRIPFMENYAESVDG